MRVLVINTNCERSPDTVLPTGACFVASAVKDAGHDVYFLDLTFSRSPKTDLLNTIRSCEPEAIALSVRNIDNCDMIRPKSYMPFARELVEACRNIGNSPLVIGGAGVTCNPVPMLRYLGADYAVVGEGEESLPSLLMALEAKKDPAGIPGVISADKEAYRPQVPYENSSIPSSASLLEWLDIGEYQRSGAALPVQTKRGCPFHCAYCLYPKLEGEGIRLRSPNMVAYDVEMAEKLRFGSVEFVDSVFNAPEGHAIACCEAIAGKGGNIPLQSLEINPLNVSSELIEAMDRAGFIAIGCTAESASDGMLEALDKGYCAEQLHQAARQLGKLDATRVWVFMLGGPGETEKTVNETRRFIEQELTTRDLVYIACGIRILPGTKIHASAIREGRISQDDDLLWPKFYFSSELEPERAMRIIETSSFPTANIISISDGNCRMLPFFQKVASNLHISPPYWKYAPYWNRLYRAFRPGWWQEAKRC